MPDQTESSTVSDARGVVSVRTCLFDRIQENISLAPFTTFGIGGIARYFLRVEDESDLWEANQIAIERNLPIFVLGGGSNLLVADTGFAGLVLHLVLAATIHSAPKDNDDAFLDVPAGTEWDSLVQHTCQQGLSGMECLSGIPGLVGASPIQNIGAYGQDVSQTIDSVRALDRHTGWLTDIPREACGFAYRQSIFNSTHRNRYIITGVRFRLSRSATPNLSYADLAPLRGTSPSPLDVYHAVRAIRERKGMVIDPAHPHPDTRSAGSFFKNPVVPAAVLAAIAASRSDAVPHWPTASGDMKLAAAWLIEQAGFPKGFSLGPVGISSRHTLALVNRSGTATCADLLRLRDTIVAGVRERFNVTLEQEPVYLS